MSIYSLRFNQCNDEPQYPDILKSYTLFKFEKLRCIGNDITVCQFKY